MYVYVKAMSVNQTEFKNYIFDHADLIALHIAKLLLYPQSDSLNHWMKEIHAFLSDVPELKKNNKRPSAELISSCLIDFSGDRGDDFKQYAIEDEHFQPIVDVSADVIEKAYCGYCVWLGESLSDHKVSFGEVKSKLLELIDRYKAGGDI